jgi:hypothetical protein
MPSILYIDVIGGEGASDGPLHFRLPNQVPVYVARDRDDFKFSSSFRCVREPRSGNNRVHWQVLTPRHEFHCFIVQKPD